MKFTLSIKSHLRSVLVLFTGLSMIVGLAYPLMVTLVAQLVFPHQAQGSLISENGSIVGSRLIGQSFQSPEYFWGRPSATAPMPYNSANSGGSNFSITNNAHLENIKERIQKLKSVQAHDSALIPVDLITASGSGLDPDISLAAAYYQAKRIADKRHIPEIEVRNLIAANAEFPTLDYWGEPKINVLKLNLALLARVKEIHK